MLHKHNSFYVTLFSNGSLDCYPENTLSKFTVKLPYTIELYDNDNWYVGLHSALLSEFQYETVQRALIKISNDYTSFINTPATVITFISSSKIFFADALKEIENAKFVKKYENVEYKKILTDNIDIKKYVAIVFTEGFNICLERNKEYSIDELFKFIYSQIPKNKRNEATEKFKSNLNKKEFQNSSLFEDTFIEIVVLPSHKIFFYLDIIKPQIVNNSIGRIVYINPIKSSMIDNTEIVIPNIQYRNLEKCRINEISILLTDENGNQINFMESMNSTCLVLHFRKGI